MMPSPFGAERPDVRAVKRRRNPRRGTMILDNPCRCAEIGALPLDLSTLNQLDCRCSSRGWLDRLRFDRCSRALLSVGYHYVRSEMTNVDVAVVSSDLRYLRFDLAAPAALVCDQVSARSRAS